ncbi:MAG: hypothetical protein K2O09_06560, partial [Treponemataceae bacterium]|nr:hypothetical protein [Treponemataceae bacterium]
EKAGISVPFMTQIELGRKSASLEVIPAALGVPYRQLFDELDRFAIPARHLSSLERRLSDSILNVIHEEFSNF